jgi:hypothetical protein
VNGSRALPAPASRNALALLHFPDRRTGWVVVAAASLAAPPEGLDEHLQALHGAVPMVGARLRGEVWHPGTPPEPVMVDGEPLGVPVLLDPFRLDAEPPLRVLVGAGGARVAVACHHAAFDGLGLVAVLAALLGGPPPAPPAPTSGGRPPAELRGLLGRLARPADRVAPSPLPPPADALAVREVALSGPGVTARLAAAAVAAAGARNARLGRPWRRVGINLGLAGSGTAGAPAFPAEPGQPDPGAPADPGDPGQLAADAAAAAGAPGQAAAGPPGAAGDQGQAAAGAFGAAGAPGPAEAGYRSRYRRVDLRAGEAVGPAVAAALASPREPVDQVWSPRLGRLLGPLARRGSDSLLVSNLGRLAVPGATRLDFFPVARGRSAVAVGAAGLVGGPSTVSVRARDLSTEDAEALLADIVARLEAGA